MPVFTGFSRTDFAQNAKGLKSKTMDPTLFQSMLEWESQRFGFRARDLKGEPILKTELDWVHSQASANVVLDDSQALLPHHLDTAFWKTFAAHLYNTHRQGMSSIIQTTLHFLDDLQESYPNLSAWAFKSAEVLKMQQRELDRLLKVYQLLKESQRGWNHLPHPTEGLDETLFREGWLRLQKEGQILRLEDTFRLISRHEQQSRAYLKAQSTNRSILLRLDPLVLKLLKEGDILPMALVGSDPKHLSVESCQYPIINDE